MLAILINVDIVSLDDGFFVNRSIGEEETYLYTTEMIAHT